MAPIRYHYTGDEDQLPVTPPPPLNLDEDSDSWWAGVRHCFVAVPLAAALAATALSASLAFGVTQHTEDIVEQPAPQIAVEDYYFVPILPRSHWFVWLPPADEEIVPQPQALTVEDDYWHVLSLFQNVRPVQPWAADDDVSVAPAAFAPDEDFWIPPILRLGGRTGCVLPWVDEEIVPQQLADEEYWWNFRSSEGRPAVKAWSEDDPLPIPLPPLDEDYWWVPTPAYAPVFLQLPIVPDPEDIPAGVLVAFTIDDVIISTVDDLTPKRGVDDLTPKRTVDKL